MDSSSWNENNLENESPRATAGEPDPNLSALADKMQFLTLGAPNVSRRPTRFNTNAWSTPLRSIENQQSRTTREQIYKTGSNHVDISLTEMKSDDVDGNSLSNLSDLLPDQSIFEKTSDFIEFCLTFPEESNRIDVFNKTTLATPTRQIRSSYEPSVKPNVANSDLSPPEKMSPTQELLPNVSDRECFAGEATLSVTSVDNELLTNMGSPLLPSSPKLVEAKLDDSANSSKLLNHVTDCLHPQSLVINEQRPRSPKSPFVVTCDENEVESDENALLPEDSIDRLQVYVSDSSCSVQEDVITNLTTVDSSPLLQHSQSETSDDLILSRNEQVDGPFASLKSSAPEEPSVDLKGFCELEATQNTTVFSLRMSCGIDESSCIEDERDTSARSSPSLLASDRFSNIVEGINGASIGSEGADCSVPNVGTSSPKELTSLDDQTHFSTRMSPNNSPKSCPPSNSVEVGYPTDNCVAVISNATEEVLQIGTSIDDNVEIVPDLLLDTEEGASKETSDCSEDCVDSQNSSFQIRYEGKHNVSLQPSSSVEVGYPSDTCFAVLSNATEEVLQIGTSLDNNVKIVSGGLLDTEEGASMETSGCSEDCVDSQNSSFQICCEVKDNVSCQPGNSVEVGYLLDTCVAGLPNAIEKEVLQIGSPLDDTVKIVPDVLLDTEEGASTEPNFFEDCVDSPNSSFQIHCEIKDNVFCQSSNSEEELQIRTPLDDNVKIVPDMLLDTDEGASTETNDCFEDCVDSPNSSFQIRCEVKDNVCRQPSSSVEVGYPSDTCVAVLSNATEEVLQIGTSLDNNVKIVTDVTEEGASIKTSDCSEDCVDSQNSSFQIHCEGKHNVSLQPSNSVEVGYPSDTCVAVLSNATEEVLQIGTSLDNNVKIVTDVTEEGASIKTSDCSEDCVDSQNSSFQIHCEGKHNVSLQPSNSVEVGYPSDTCVAVLSNATEEVLQIGISLDNNVKIVSGGLLDTEEGASMETSDCSEDCVDSQNSSFQIRCEVNDNVFCQSSNSVEVGYHSDKCVGVLSNATEEVVLQIGASLDDNVKIVPDVTEEGASTETNDCSEDCVDSQNSSFQIRCEVKHNVSCQPINSVEVGYHSDTCVGVLSKAIEEEVLQIGASSDDNVKIVPDGTEEGASMETSDCSEDCVDSQNSSFQIRCEVKDNVFCQSRNSVEVGYPLDTCVAGLPNAIEEEVLQIGTPLDDTVIIVRDVLLDTEEGASTETNDCFEDCVDSQNSSFQIRCEVKNNVFSQPSNSVEVGYPSDTCVPVLSNATEEEVLQIGASSDDNVKTVPDVTEEGASMETSDCSENCVDSQNSSFQICCEVKHQGDEIPSTPPLKSTVNDPSCSDGENRETSKNESFSECQVKEDCHSEEVVSLDGATFGETTIISTCAKKAASNTVGFAVNKLMSLCTPVKEIRTPCRTTPFRCEKFGKGGQRIIFDLPTNLLDVSIGMLESMTAMMAPAESASSAMYQGDQNLTSNFLSGARTPKAFSAISNQPSSSNSPANSDNCLSIFNMNTQLLEENTNLKSDIEEYKMKYDVLQEEYQSLLKTASAVRTNETTLKSTLQEYEDEIRKVNNKYLILKEYANTVILSLNSSLNRLEDELREKNDEIRKLKNAS